MGFKLISLNINSLISNKRRADLVDFLNKYKPDVLTLSETKLSLKHKIYFKEYECFRFDRPNSKRGGGTAILIKRSIPCTRFNNDNINKFKSLETTIINIPLRNNKKLIIVAIYIPYKKGTTAYKSEFTSLFENLNINNLNNYYIIVGDLNAKHIAWSNKCNCERGKFLQGFIDSNEINYRISLYHSNIPSFPKGDSFLDIALIDKRITINSFAGTTNQVETLIYDSDHRALLLNFTIKNENLFSHVSISHQSKYRYKVANWSKFQKYLIKIIKDPVPNNKCLSHTEIEDYLSKLDAYILEAMESKLPKININSYNSTDNFINEKITNLRHKKNKILTKLNKYYKFMKKYNIINTKYELALKSLLKYLNKKLNREFILSSNKYWQNVMSNIKSSDSANMFPQLNKIFRSNKPKPIDLLRSTDAGIIKTMDNDLNKLSFDISTKTYTITGEEDCLNLIGAHFEQIHIKKLNPVKSETEKLVERKLKQFKPLPAIVFSIDCLADNELIEDMNMNTLFVNVTSVKKLIHSLKNKTSSGINGIPNIVIKNLPDIVLRFFTILFNNISNNAYFPSSWKTAKVFPLLKKGKNPDNPSSYRPISLLPAISKIYEKIIKNSLNNENLKLNIIPDNQFGFKEGHATTHAITKLVSDINWGFAEKRCTGALTIDLEKAFDRVWQDGLIAKMININYNPHLIAIVASMIKNKKFIINFNGICSKKTFLINEGLQQGTVCSPILFNIFTANLLKKLSNSLAFADDILLYHSSNKIENIIDQLQNDALYIKKYCEDWNMSINWNKCECILFHINIRDASRDTRKNYKEFKIKIDNIVIQPKKYIKYLGIYLDSKLNYKEHMEQQMQKAKSIFNMTCRLFYSKALDRKVKLIAYQTLIRPILTYGCQIWFNITASTMEMLRKYERKCLRSCMYKFFSRDSGYTKYITNKALYHFANISRIDIFIIKLIRRHCRRSGNMEGNNLICGPFLTISEGYYERSKLSGFVPPEHFIFLDRDGLIQDINTGIPLLYHAFRPRGLKTICYKSCMSNNDILWRFDTSIPKVDIPDVQKLIKDYWWLNLESQK